MLETITTAQQLAELGMLVARTGRKAVLIDQAEDVWTITCPTIFTGTEPGRRSAVPFIACVDGVVEGSVEWPCADPVHMIGAVEEYGPWEVLHQPAPAPQIPHQHLPEPSNV